MTTKREHWGSRFGFIMAAAGSAIGLGTMWQFPYMLGQNGGGAFLLIYLLCTLFIGVPVFIAELLIGRMGQKGTVGVFHQVMKKHTPWCGVGWLAMASSLIILAYYCVVAGWGIHYFFMSLCQFYVGLNAKEIGSIFDTMLKSPGLNISGQIIFLLITAGVVYQGIRKGIEYWAKILTPALLILLLCLLLYGVTLKGFPEAMRFIFYPDFSQIKPSGILASLGLAFFTLSLGQGIMLTYGSYMEKSTDVPKTTLIVASMDIVVSIFCAMMIFPIMFTFGFPVEEGKGLIFKVMPALFSQLPAALLISCSFFLLFVFTALTSSVALLEVSVANWIDLFGFSRKKAVILSSVIIFILGVPCALSGSGLLFPDWQVLYGMNFFDTMVHLISLWFLPIGGLLVTLFAGWMFQKRYAALQFEMGSTLGKFFGLWLFFVRWIAPLAIFLIVLQNLGFFNIDALFS